MRLSRGMTREEVSRAVVFLAFMATWFNDFSLFGVSELTVLAIENETIGVWREVSKGVEVGRRPLTLRTGHP
jgi:hypothetical protein